MKKSNKNKEFIVSKIKMISTSDIIVPFWAILSILNKNFELYEKKKMKRRSLLELMDIFEFTDYNDLWTEKFFSKLYEHDREQWMDDEDPELELENSFAAFNELGEVFEGFDDDFWNSDIGTTSEPITPYGDYPYNEIICPDFRKRKYYSGLKYTTIDGLKFCNLCGKHLHKHEINSHVKKCFVKEEDFDFDLWNDSENHISIQNQQMANEYRINKMIEIRKKRDEEDRKYFERINFQKFMDKIPNEIVRKLPIEIWDKIWKEQRNVWDELDDFWS
jgi:hypothetical protein